MRRITVLLGVLALLVAACGDGDATTESTAGSTSTTAAAPTTTIAPTTTVAAAPSGPGGFIAAAAELVGEYEGEWDNATFGSTGPLHIEVMEANTEAGFVLIRVDADGNAFGAADPEPFVIEISVAGDVLHVGFSEFLGESTFEIDDAGTFTMSAAPPALGGMTLDVAGGITSDGFGGTYDIPGLANGTWSAAPTS